MNNQQNIREDEIILDQNFWNYRWENHMTGWDIGEASPAIAAYFEQYPNKNAAILIPGCGNAYEAEMLVENGFTNITLVDIAPKAVEILKEKFTGRKEIMVFCEDFYEHEGQYDIIIEQTFFCTMSLSRRKDYVKKIHSLLKNQGRLVGVLFSIEFEHSGPPFGGRIDIYQELFEQDFNIKTLNACYNSIAPRQNSEVFINFIKK